MPSANDMILLLSSSRTLFFSCSGLIVLARTCKTVLNRNDVIPELFLILRRPLSKCHSLVLCTIRCFVESLYSIKEVFIYSCFVRSRMDVQFYPSYFLHQVVYEGLVFTSFCSFL